MSSLDTSGQIKVDYIIDVYGNRFDAEGNVVLEKEILHGDIQQNFSGAILGFRKWEVNERDSLLMSVTNNKSWQSGVNFSEGCHGHSPPGNDCHCGWNAYYTLEKSEKSYSGVLGAILGAGSTELHEDGFRSSEAQIIALLYEGYRGDIDSIEKIALVFKRVCFRQ